MSRIHAKILNMKGENIMFHNFEKKIDEYADSGLPIDSMRKRADELSVLSSDLRKLRIVIPNFDDLHVSADIASEVIPYLGYDVDAINERLAKLAAYCEKQSRWLFDVADETEEDDKYAHGDIDQVTGERVKLS